MVQKSFNSLAFDRWPEPDRKGWLRGTAPADPFDKPGVGSSWRPATQATVRAAYGIALRWLEDQGWLEEHVMPPARWTADRLRAYVQDLSSRLRPATVRHRLLNLERALAVLAPDVDRSMFHIAVRNVPITTNRSGKRDRLQDPATLVNLGFRLMQAAEAGARKNIRHNAVLYRTGLQIALLAMRPLRMRNFTSIRIGTNLARKGRTWWLLFGSDETKTKLPIEEMFPEALYVALERYITVYRPLLAAGRYRGERLWLSYRCAPQVQHTLQLAIVRVTKAAFGNPINPHLFRDCAATSIATHDPAAVCSGAALLGHGRFATTEKYYNQASGLEAMRSYKRLIEARRVSPR